jgi:hypothetical protein
MLPGAPAIHGADAPGGYPSAPSFAKVRCAEGAQHPPMWFQPIVFFAAAAWAFIFIVFGLYLLVRRGPARVVERALDLLVALVVAALGAGIFIGGLYLVEELI